MAIEIDVKTAAIATLDDVAEHFASVDISDRDKFLEGAPVLRALANNRTFLTERITEELKSAYDLQRSNQYSAQVFHLGRGRNFFLRANFWPAENDLVTQSSGKQAFYYGVPHDHNFDFLTVGYFGPGYISDFYDYDFEQVVGYAGEKLDLRFVAREALSVGRMKLYRRSIDIHEQLPPESFSISLNVVTDFAQEVSTVNQYMIDLQSRTIRSLGNRTSLPLICEVAAHIGDDECRQLISDLSLDHPYPRGRYAALSALAQLCPADAERIWSRGAADVTRYVSVQSQMQLEALAS